MKRLLIFLAVFLLLLSIGQQGVRAQEKLRVFILGPDVLPINGKTQYNVSATGGPAEKGGFYNITAFFLGPNVSDISPSPGDVFLNKSTMGSWIINASVSSRPQTLDLVVRVYSVFGNESEEVEKRFKVKVVGPVVLTARVGNPLNITLRNVPVDFYVDDKFIGSTTISEIEPFGEAFATYDWVVLGVPQGRHKLTAVVDLNRDGVIDPDQGDSCAVSYFYAGGGISTMSIVLFVGIAILVALIVILLIRSRRQRR